jgi:hypothetical protein
LIYRIFFLLESWVRSIQISVSTGVISKPSLVCVESGPIGAALTFQSRKSSGFFVAFQRICGKLRSDPPPLCSGAACEMLADEKVQLSSV